MRKKPLTMASKRPISKRPAGTRSPGRHGGVDQRINIVRNRPIVSAQIARHPPSISYERPTFKNRALGLPMIAAGIAVAAPGSPVPARSVRDCSAPELDGDRIRLGLSFLVQPPPKGNPTAPTSVS
jgi:hypothetical protein